MRAHRGKFDISKPFRLVPSAADYHALVPTERLFPLPEEVEQHTKEEIVVPRIEVVPRLTPRKPTARIPLHYIRLPASLCLPRPEAYELSEVDWLFLSGLRERFAVVRDVLDEDFLCRVVVELERKAGRDSVLPRSKGWVVSFLEKHYAQLITLPNFEELASILYNYWKSRRQELRFPLWRPLWRPADNELNHMLAFKAREKRSRNLRRTNRMDETEIIQDLHEEYQNAAMLCERIQLREELKLRSIHLQLLAFTQECKGLLEVPPPSLEDLIRNDPREKLRAIKVSTEEFKRMRERPGPPVQPQVELPNQRESIAFFLANVVHEAERFGISHDSLFPSPDNALPLLKTALSQTNKMIQVLPAEEPPVACEETARFSIRRVNDLLVRSLSSDDEERETVPKDYLVARRSRVSRYYMGEDDQLGDIRDLRKVISSSFKRFLQMNH